MNRFSSKLLLVIFFLCYLLQHSFAQVSIERPFRQFTTQSVLKQALNEQPELISNLAQLEAYISTYGSAGDTRLDTIPVVFHILQSEGQPSPDESSILDQLDALNRAFGSYEATLEPFVFDKIQAMAAKAIHPGIYFCLPTMDVTGAPFAPIRYSISSVQNWSDDQAIMSASSGGADPIDPSRFLNIWVAQLEHPNSGFATFPGISIQSDGIVIDPDYFGVSANNTDPYSGGKSLAHLVGSYLGLYELWNEAVPCGDDQVDDTPIHNAPNYGIGANFHHVSLCDSLPIVEMIINYMDNTDDVALTMFTQGQKNRMKAVLSDLGPRTLLTKWNNACQPEGAFAQPYISNPQTQSVYAVNSFNAFPNPAANAFYLEIFMQQPGKVKFIVLNSLGETISTFDYQIQSMTNQVFSQDCSSWPSGTYFIRAAFEDGSNTAKSIRINNQ